MAPPPPDDSTTDEAATPSSSLSGRLINVFATPGEVFGELVQRPFKAGNWLVPLLLACVVGIGSVWVMFSQESLWHQIREQKDQAIEKKLQDMPEAQREEAMKAINKFSSPRIMKFFGIAGVLISTVVWLFMLSFLLWLLGRLIFKSGVAFAKTLEVCGLASMIEVLGGVVKTLLILATGNLYAAPGASLLISDFDPANKVHLLLSALNVVTFWYIAVLVIGVSRLNRIPVVNACLWLFIPWALFRFGLIWIQTLGQGL